MSERVPVLTIETYSVQVTTDQSTQAPPTTADAFTRTIRIGIYCRISSDREGAGIGVETQEELCRAKAAAIGELLRAAVVIVAVFVDNDISALQRKKPRKDYRRMLGMIHAGALDAVVTWHVDRLFRNLTELEEYCDVCKAASVGTETVKAGAYDMSTATGQMVAGIVGVVAKFESQHKAENVSKAAKKRAYEGKPVGGPRAFGFEKDEETPRWSEAVEIANGTALVLKGGSVGSQVTSLNERGILTSKGNQWRVSDWTRVLLRPRNAGIRTYKGEEIGRTEGETIVSEPDYRAVCAILKDPSRRTSPGNTPKWLGSLLYTCDPCGKGLTCSGQTKRDNEVYRCRAKGGGHAVRDAVSLDLFITDMVLERLSRPDAALLLRKGSGEDVGALLAEKAALGAQLDGFGVELANGMNARVVAVAVAAVERKLTALDVRIAAAADVDPLGAIVGANDVRERWDGLHLDLRKSIVRELLAVEVRQVWRGSREGGPADPMTGLTLTWKRTADQ